jgi:hypothetical protein
MHPFQYFFSDNKKLIHFDYKECDWVDFFDIILRYPSQNFNVITINGKNKAVGNGATRAFYSRMFEQMLETIFVKVGAFYFDFNLKHSFWSMSYSYKAFAKFIILSHDAGCKLSRHLAPKFFENLNKTEFTIDQLGNHMHRLHPDIYESTHKLSETEFANAETGYESLEAYYRHQVCQLGQDKCLFNLFVALQNALGLTRCELLQTMAPADADAYISGEYEISQQLLQSFFYFNPQTPDIENKTLLWHNFLSELTQHEIFDMLISLCGSLNPSGSIQIKMLGLREKDSVKISTCHMILELHESMFENLETIRPLKYCFLSSIKQDVIDSATDIAFVERLDDGIFTDDLWTSSSETPSESNLSTNADSSSSSEEPEPTPEEIDVPHTPTETITRSLNQIPNSIHRFSVKQNRYRIHKKIQQRRALDNLFNEN